MKQLQIVLFLFLTTIIAKAQNSEIEWFWTKGTITRNSTIIDGERYFNGPFIYNGKGLKFANNMSVKGTYKNSKFNGDFFLSRQGPIYGGVCEYMAKGKFISDTLDGLWIFKSKSIIDGLSKNKTYSHDNEYKVKFDKGVIVTFEKTDKIENYKEFWQGDKLGLLNGLQKIEYKENGFSVVLETLYSHGIKIYSKKYDLASGKVLGKIEIYEDTTLINGENFNFDNLTFNKADDKTNINSELEIKQKSFNDAKLYLDSLKISKSRLTILRRDSSNISDEINDIYINYQTAKEDSLRNKNLIQAYNTNDIKINFSNEVKNYKTYLKSKENENIFNKFKKNLIKNNKISEGGILLILSKNNIISALSLEINSEGNLNSYNKIELNEDEKIKLDNIVSKEYLVFDLGTDSLIKVYTGLDTTFFNSLIKENLFKNIYHNYWQESSNYKLKLSNLSDDIKNLKNSIEFYSKKTNDINQIEKEIYDLKKTQSENILQIKRK
jgi:hypothetical protein